MENPPTPARPDAPASVPVHPSEALARPLTGLPDPLPVMHLATRGKPIFFARIRPPGSKSLTNRALLLASLAGGASVIRGGLAGADDTDRMIACLRTLGAAIEIEGDQWRIAGVDGRWRVGGDVTLDAGNAGTVARFLAGAALLAPPGASLTIDGGTRMRERPIADLASALEDLGATVRYTHGQGRPPVLIEPPDPLPAGEIVDVPSTLSSQFISALLLVAPWLPGGLTVRLEGEVVSRSYILMTLGLLDELGATVKTSDDLRLLRVAGAPGGRGLRPFELDIEPDASAATYFWGAAALFPGAIARIDGLDHRSLQGDSDFPEVLSRMGATVVREEGEKTSIGVRGPAALAPVMADMADMPDAALTLAVVCAFANGRSVIRGLRTLRVKESDRIAALQAELSKIGVGVETQVLGDPDAITITPPPGGVDTSAAAPRVEFDTYDDHRLAMALALIGLRRPNVLIRNPACVRKTYPEFWKDFGRLY